jgi:hypothetical protein
MEGANPCQLTFAFFRKKFHRIWWIFSIAILIVGKLSCDMFGLKRERVGVELVNTQQTFVSNLPLISRREFGANLVNESLFCLLLESTNT